MLRILLHDFLKNIREIKVFLKKHHTILYRFDEKFRIPDVEPLELQNHFLQRLQKTTDAGS